MFVTYNQIMISGTHHLFAKLRTGYLIKVLQNDIILKYAKFLNMLSFLNP